MSYFTTSYAMPTPHMGRQGLMDDAGYDLDTEDEICEDCKHCNLEKIGESLWVNCELDFMCEKELKE